MSKSTGSCAGVIFTAPVPKEKSTKARFLAVLQIAASGSESFVVPVREPSGAVRVGNWRITAGLDASEPASLLVERSDGAAGLAVDCASATVSGREYELSGAESGLVEEGGEVVRRCGDEVPVAAR